MITDRVLTGQIKQPDIAFGLAVSSLVQFKEAGLLATLATYKPAGVERLRAFARDPASPYAWTGMDAYLGVICFNTDLAEHDRITRPSFWRDLVSPRLKGRVVMPDPVQSGTGYLIVAGWLRSMGEDAAWAFMDQLHQNVAAYLTSGTAPCREASSGRQLAGLSCDMRAAAEKAAGAPIDIVVPVDGTGWDQEGFAIFAGSAHPDSCVTWPTGRQAGRPTNCMRAAIRWWPIRVCRTPRRSTLRMPRRA